MALLASIACVFGLVVVSSAHLCLVSPHQRGDLAGLNKPGAGDCLLLTAPCGGRNSTGVKVTWVKDFDIIFQKNLDHWTKTSHGYFDVNLWDSNMHKTHLARVNDAGEPSLHMYSVAGTLPSNIANGDYILQVEYTTGNPNAPPNFYQCADVSIMKS